MNEKKLRLALVGKDVSKSDSERIHRFILGKMGYALEYEQVSVAAPNFDFAARRLLGDFDGFNVTIPYKRDIMEYLEKIEGDARIFGAVNTVVCDGAVGYNTDGDGFLEMLRVAGVEPCGRKCLIVGAGGAGRSVAVSLKKSGAKVSLYRRNQKELQETCLELGVFPAKTLVGYDLVINASGVGMHDTEGVSPVGAETFEGAQAAIDLIYVPRETEFLRLAKTKGIKAVGGAAMLFFQAYYSDCYFTQKSPSKREMDGLYEEYLKEQEV
ncbi:MAG: shikimate dehydrogenase [Clostridia bacterium]|nr:shikimate dehydrogenase [Clostridia bacterium]